MSTYDELKLVSVVHSAVFPVDRLMEIFGIPPATGRVVQFKLEATATGLVEVTVRRYVTKGELDQLLAELEARETKPTLMGVKP